MFHISNISLFSPNFIFIIHSEFRNKRIRYNLKVAIKRRDRERLPPAVEEFKKAKLPDDDMDLEKAERLLKEFQARDGRYTMTVMFLMIIPYCIPILPVTTPTGTFSRAGLATWRADTSYLEFQT